MSKPRIPIPTIPDFFTPKELCIKAQGREALRAAPLGIWHYNVQLWKERFCALLKNAGRRFGVAAAFFFPLFPP